jgi:hypothetical protein
MTAPAANGTVLLSWGLWKRRFGGNPAILNQTIELDSKPFTVIGVMPAWFDFRISTFVTPFPQQKIIRTTSIPVARE